MSFDSTGPGGAMSEIDKVDSPAADIDDYAEVMSSIRHYSALRFAMLTLFSGAIAGLIVGQYGGYQTGLPRPVAPVAGLLITVIFLWLEITLDSYMNTFEAVARTLKPAGHWSSRSAVTNSLVVIPLRSLYVLVFVFWLWSLYQSLCE